MTITELSIKRPTLVVVIFTILTILGIISYLRLNYNLFPKFETPVITVVTAYPGASPGVVETSVTEKIEDVLSSLENVDKIVSTSQEGVSIVTIQLTNEGDVDKALEDAQRKVNTIIQNLPEEVITPTLNKFSFDDLPIMQFSASSNLPPAQFYELMEDRIKAALSKIEGVGQITLLGGNKREIFVNVDQEKLKAYNVSLPQLVSAIKNANQEFPAGNVESRENQFSLRVTGEFTSVNELADQVVIATPTGSLIRVKDVASVRDAIQDPETINRINAENAIGVLVQKQTDANTVDVAAQVKAKLVELEKNYSKSKLNFVIASDTSVFTLAAANSVINDLFIAIVLVALVMLVFLHSLRNAAIIMFAIPLSIISTFIAMDLLGFSLNLMTLMALSLVIGILVDDSIVVLENIYRHLEMGKDRRTAALEGRNEIGFTALSITLVDVVVFGPLSLVGGLIGNILREFSIVVIISTLMSLFVSFTVTPTLASRFSKIIHFSKDNFFGRFSIWFEKGFENLKNNYASSLRWSLNHRKTIAFSTLVLLVLSIALVPLGFIGSAFIASSDRGEFIITIETDQKNTLYKTNLIAREVEQLLLSKPLVEKVFTSVGQSTTMGGNQPTNNVAQLTVVIIDKKQRAITVDEFANQVKDEILRIPGVKASSVPTGLTGNASNLPVNIIVLGAALDNVLNSAKKVMETINDIPGVSDPNVSVNEGKPQLEVLLDRERMASLSLSVSDVGNTLRTAFAGNTDAKFREAGEEYDIRIGLDKFDQESIEDVKKLAIRNQQGQLIELQQIAQIVQSAGPTKLERYNRIPSVSVTSNIVGRPVGTVGEEIKAAVSKLSFPEGVTVTFGGQMEQQAEAFQNLFIAFCLGIVFVYLIMVALYESYVFPFVVLFSIPLAIIGALITLALTMETLNIFSILGMIMMIGLVAKNAILLVDFTNKLKAEGHSSYDALIEAGKERIRPILMTTLTMIFGMLPIALAKGPAAEAKNGLAWVLIGGLTSSMVLTLVVVPIVYLTVDNQIRKIKYWREKKKFI